MTRSGTLARILPAIFLAAALSLSGCGSDTAGAPITPSVQTPAAPDDSAPDGDQPGTGGSADADTDSTDTDADSGSNDTDAATARTGTPEDDEVGQALLKVRADTIVREFGYTRHEIDGGVLKLFKDSPFEEGSIDCMMATTTLGGAALGETPVLIQYRDRLVDCDDADA